MHFILFYDVVDGYAEKRAPFRQAHLAHATQAVERKELFLGGALADPVDQALIVFTSREAAERFANTDPYVENGLVKRWYVREWTTVIGTALI
jgi:uncharacterized protein